MNQSGLEQILGVFALSVTDFWMICVVAAAFTLYSFVAGKVFFLPFLKNFEAREALTTGADSEASALVERASAIEAEIDERINSARIDAVKEKLEKLQGSQKEASALLLEAENDAQAVVVRGREEIHREIDQLKAELFSRVDDLASDVSRSISDNLTGSGVAH